MTTVPAAPHGPTDVTIWTTVFSDSFPGTVLDTSKWWAGGVPTGTASPYSRGFNTDGTPPTPGGNWQVYNSAMVSVSGGYCTLTCQAIPGGGTITADPTVGGVGTVYHYESGCIVTTPDVPDSTHPGFLFEPATRTVIQALIQVPAAGVGIWPAWWTSSFGLWTYEVDVFEFYDSSTQPQQNIHFVNPALGGTTNNDQSGPHVATLGDLSLTLHEFTADINANGAGRVDFYIDGTLITSFTEPGYATAQMELILNVALNSASPTNLPATMKIGYVAVYQPEITVTSVAVAPLDGNNHLATYVTDGISATVFTSAQTSASLVHTVTHRYDCTSASIAQSLPAAPPNGTKLSFMRLDAVVAHALTVTVGGSDTIEPSPFNKTTATIEPGKTVTFVYQSGVWTPVSDHWSTSGLTLVTDQRYRNSWGPNVVEFHVNDYAGADWTGATSSDAAVISATTAANNAIGNGALQSYIVHGVGTYKETVGNIITSNSAVGIVGPGESACTINVQGNGACWAKRTQTGNWVNTAGNWATPGAAKIGGFTLDGTACGTTTWAAGILDIDVMRGWYEDLWAQNFEGPIGTGNAASGRSAALWQYTAEFWSERCVGRRLTFINNSLSHLQDGGTSTYSTGQSGGTAGTVGPASFDYSFFSEVSLQLHAGQIGRYVINSANIQGGHYEMVVNAPMVASGAASYLWAIGIIGASGDSSNIVNCLVNVTGETDLSGSTMYDLNVSAVSGFLCHGIWSLASGGTAWSAPSGMVFADGMMSGQTTSPSMFRPIYTAVGLSGANTLKTGLWTCNQSTRYGLSMPVSQGTAPTTGIVESCGVGAPTFSGGSGDRYKRSDTPGTAGQRDYICTGGTSWTALTT
jgi:hypothetical protein